MSAGKKPKLPRNWDAVRSWNKGGSHKRTNKETGREFRKRWRSTVTEEEEWEKEVLVEDDQ